MSAPVIAFDDLRRAVESAHGHTCEVMCLCERELAGGGTEMVLLTTAQYEAESPRPRVILRTQHEAAVADAPRAKITLDVDGETVPTSLKGLDADAVFCTQSAIEKFFFPYYQRVLPRAEFAALLASYYEPVDEASRIVAFTHYPPSIYVSEGRRDSATELSSAVLARAAGGLRSQLGALRADGRYVRNMITP